MAEAQSLTFEIKRLRVGDEGIHAACPRRLDHLGRRIEADHPCAGRHDLLGQDAVAASDVEDQLARLRRQQLQRRRAERRHEGGIGRIIGRRPLGGGIDAHKPLLIFRHWPSQKVLYAAASIRPLELAPGRRG